MILICSISKMRKYIREVVAPRIHTFRVYRIKPFVYCLRPSEEKRKLKQFKDREKNGRIIIVGSGPSLNENDILMIRDEKTIVVNGSIVAYSHLNLQPTYYMTSCKVVIDEYAELIENTKAEKFCDISLRQQVEENKIDVTFYAGYIKNTLFTNYNDYSKKDMKIRKNISSFGVCKNGIFIVAQAIQMAIFMGAKEIVLLGCDCGSSPQGLYHFEGNVLPKYKTKEQEDHNYKVFFDFISVADKYCKKRGIRLLNATNGGYLESIERKSLSDVLKAES